MAGGDVMLITQVKRYVSLRQALGFKLHEASSHLYAFARFAAERGETRIRAETAVAWAAEANSPNARRWRGLSRRRTDYNGHTRFGVRYTQHYSDLSPRLACAFQRRWGYGSMTRNQMKFW